jgi:thiol-disulfide isomerase/thioredoxin
VSDFHFSKARLPEKWLCQLYILLLHLFVLSLGRLLYIHLLAQFFSSIQRHSINISATPSTMQSSSSSLPGIQFLQDFLTSRCGHCKNLAPQYIKAAEHMAGIVPFAAVDCDEDSNRQLCAEFQVQGFPTIKLMKHVNGRLDARGM